MKLIMESLEEVLEDSDYLATGIELVRENAARRAQSHAVACPSKSYRPFVDHLEAPRTFVGRF